MATLAILSKRICPGFHLPETAQNERMAGRPIPLTGLDMKLKRKRMRNWNWNWNWIHRSGLRRGMESDYSVSRFSLTTNA